MTNNKIKLDEGINLQWKVEECNSDSILFYYFPSVTTERINSFLNAIEDLSFKKCIVNIKTEVNSQKVIQVDNEEWFRTLKEYCDALYPLPASKKIAITGTNGKTTTTDILRQLLLFKNQNVLTIGTLGVWLNEKKVNDFSLTTPHYLDFRKEAFKHKYNFLIVEASSHALDQDRFHGIDFDYSIWTSFSQDHLDYHKTMNNYFEAKRKIFGKTTERVFVGEDESFVKKLKSEKLCLVKNIVEIETEYFKVGYNKKNLNLALTLLNTYGYEYSERELKKLVPTPGRFNIVKKKNISVVIDFAHTADALSNIGRELSLKAKRIICVFGCGGNRDKEKRPLMAKAVSHFADYIFITNDNPRLENPLEIIQDIERGVTKENFKSILDRKEAIKQAIELAQSYDVDKECFVLIAGKGHEKYIDQNGIKTYFSDEEEVKRVLNVSS